MVMRTRFIGSVGAALAAGLLVTAIAPASAAPQPSRAAQTEEASGNTTAAAAPKADKRQYCIRYTPTGTRIERKTCKTKADWLADGVDIDNPEQ